uniref:Uncharacterized protein n=1 Tax=Oryza punctata TaxID=4537 RepID=A0A0E0LAP9_ORYPU
MSSPTSSASSPPSRSACAPVPRTSAAGTARGPTSGIGRAMAMELARRGLNVVLVGRDPAKLREVAAAIVRSHSHKGVRTKTVVFDFSLVSTVQGDKVMTMLREVVEGLDVRVLVNNAGVAKPGAMYLHEVEVDTLMRMIWVNVLALMKVTAVVLLGMAERGRGAIFNIDSASAEALPSFPRPSTLSTPAPKHMLFSSGLSVEYRSKGIDVQCEVPFLVETNMIPRAMKDIFLPQFVVTPEDYARRVCVPNMAHRVQFLAMRFTPDFAFNWYRLRLHLQQRTIFQSWRNHESQLIRTTYLQALSKITTSKSITISIIVQGKSVTNDLSKLQPTQAHIMNYMKNNLPHMHIILDEENIQSAARVRMGGVPAAAAADLRQQEPPWPFVALVIIGAIHVAALAFRLVSHLSLCLRRPRDLRRRYGAWAVVTGPTSGIGRSMALELARRGLNLVLVGRDPAKLHDISETISKLAHAAVGTRTVVFDLALASTAEGDEALRRLREAVAGLDVGVVVNNAGVARPCAVYLHEADVEAWVRMIRVNLWAVTEVTAAVLMGMVARGRGAVVNIGSGSTEAIPSFPLYSVYAATKRYIAEFSRSLYVEYKSKGIDVQCQAPLFVATNMTSGVAKAADDAAAAAAKRSKRRQRWLSPLFVPSADAYAAAAARWIGHGAVCMPNLCHRLQWCVSRAVPDAVHDRVRLRENLRQRAVFQRLRRRPPPPDATEGKDRWLMGSLGVSALSSLMSDELRCMDRWVSHSRVVAVMRSF